MAQIFTSYSRKDTRTVDHLAERLERAGHSVWVDREGIDGGSQWRESIVKAINDADIFLLVLSEHSAASDNVRRELDLAQGAPARVMPVQFGPVQIPEGMAYQLAGVQIIDMTEDRDIGVQKLLAAMDELPGATPTAPQPAAQPAEEDPKVDLAGLGGGGFLSRLFGRR
ncbi:MAG: toll/interleukin-1 receptor domain-containing protein [Pseudomonadota bacterium]